MEHDQLCVTGAFAAFRARPYDLNREPKGEITTRTGVSSGRVGLWLTAIEKVPLNRFNLPLPVALGATTCVLTRYEARWLKT